MITLTHLGIDPNQDIVSVFESLSKAIPTIEEMYKSKIFEEIPGLYCRFFFKHLISGE